MTNTPPAGRILKEKLREMTYRSLNPILIFSVVFTLVSPSLNFAYFQQRVRYEIQVKLVPALNRLEAVEELTYCNNSSDSLTHLFFHLYVNRFAPAPDMKTSPSRSYGYQEIISIKDDRGEPMDYRIDRTLMKVNLARPLPPGDSVKMSIRFNTILPEAGDRFGYYGPHYDVGNWYPVPAVYDRHGWHTDQHYEGEFYQEWGDYRVEITVPQGYVVGATGILLNENALPDSVEFADRRPYYAIYPDTATVTYQFIAPAVHDFAWTADPEYVMRKSELDSTTLIFLILPYRLTEWEPQIEIARKALLFLQERIGPYPYPYLTVVDGYIQAGGIEYPNLVIINDQIYHPRDLSATIIHEIAHQWFYGLLANNQTRYGWMDEGFATYFENLAMLHIFGYERQYITSPTGWFGKMLGYWYYPGEDDRQIYLEYIRGGEQEPIDLHFDRFQHDPFIPYYQKMGLVVSQLRLVVGDEIFWKAIQEYYQRWKFRHPYPGDLIRVFQEVSGRNLGWFFDQWLHTIWTCDYSIEKYKVNARNSTAGSQFDATLHFRRHQPIVMPLDFRLYLKNGETLDYRIPLADGENFVPDSSASISAWEYTESEKVVRLVLPSGIRRIELNPADQLLDINPFNDDSDVIPPVYWYWMKRQYYRPHLDGYTVTVLPYAFYNQVDGGQIGLRTRGNFIYPDFQHRLNLLFGLVSLRPELEFWFEHPLYPVSRDLRLIVNLHQAAGRRGTGGWLQWSGGDRNTVRLFSVGWQGNHLYDATYYPYPVSGGNFSFVELTVRHGEWKTGYRPVGWQVNLETESSFPGSDYTYERWSAQGIIRLPLLWRQKFTGTLYTGGSGGDLPLQKAFRFGGASTDQFFVNPYLRAAGTLPAQWWSEGNVFQEGGGNLRSAAADYSPAGRYILNAFMEVTLGNPMNLTTSYVPFLSDIILAAFTSASAANSSWGYFGDFRGEAGFSLSFSRIPFLLNYFDIDQVHIDFPLWASENSDPNGVAFRWAIRIDSRSFY